MSNPALAANNLSSAVDAQAVTPSNTVNLSSVTRGLWIGVGGDVTVVMASGSVVTFTAVPSGFLLPIMVSRVNATATTAQSITALF